MHLHISVTLSQSIKTLQKTASTQRQLIRLSDLTLNYLAAGREKEKWLRFVTNDEKIYTAN